MISSRLGEWRRHVETRTAGDPSEDPIIATGTLDGLARDDQPLKR